MFETQKSGNKTSSGEIGLDIRTHASPKVGQDQVSGGVCWYAAPVANVRFRSATVKNWCNVLSMEGVTVYGHHPECRLTLGTHIVWLDPRTNHRTSLETISNVP